MTEMTEPISPREDVMKHGSALSGAVIGAAAGSFIPIIGTIGGGVIGAVVGHFHDERRHRLKMAMRKGQAKK